MTIIHSSLFRGPGEGSQPIAQIRATSLLVKVSGADTGGAYSVTECTRPGGGGWTRRQVHYNQDEAWYVLEGELTFHIDDQTRKAPAGSYVLVPRGTVHAFGHTGETATRYLLFVSPPGLEQMLMQEAALGQASPNGEPSPEAVAALHRRYSSEILEPTREQPSMEGDMVHG